MVVHGLLAHAGPVEDAKAWLDEGDDLMKKAEKAKGSAARGAHGRHQEVRPRAHAHQPEAANDAPELLKEIEKRLDDRPRCRRSPPCGATS
ncbi:MAG: hypothetical protein R3F43_28475 [bacterium]